MMFVTNLAYLIQGVCVFISTQSELEAFVKRAQQHKFVAVDTEFIREKTYFPQLCLVQLATPQEIALVDPITMSNLSPLAELMQDTTVTKIFHACDQDLEVLQHELQVRVEPVFDTQIAAGFVGQSHQAGYGSLVEHYCGVHLRKSAVLTDWSLRPLNQEQLGYAEDDVRYLPKIYTTILNELIAKNRLAWVTPEIAQLTDPARFDRDPRTAYKRLRRQGTLTRRQMAIAREVCAWREKRAMGANVPRKWILSDEVVIELCRLAPHNPSRVRQIRGAETLSTADAQLLVAAISKGKACPAEKLPETHRKTSSNTQVEGVIDLMYALVRRTAEKNGVAAQLIANRDDLHTFMKGDTTCALASGWRYELVGKQLSQLLSGQIGITVKDGHIEIL